jgi:hypothetical protein
VPGADAARHHLQGGDQCRPQRRRAGGGQDRRHPGGQEDLIPLCHPLLVGAVHVNFTIGDDYIEVETQVETVDRTGVEMEALTACAVAALTIYDMCKSTDRSMSIGELALWEKVGGRSGVWRRAVEAAPLEP